MFNRSYSVQLAFVVLLLSLAASGSIAQRQAAVTPQRSVTADLSHGATFTFKIAANLPEFTFKIIPEPQDNDPNGNARSTVRDIEVFIGGSKNSSQRLTGCDFEEMEPPPVRSDWFRVDDFNFDGYQDVYLPTSWGGTGNESGCIWLYNSESKRFDYSKEFSALSRAWLDPSTKTLLTFSNGGMVGMVHVAEKYAVENNRPVLIWSENQDWDDKKDQFHCVVQERRGNRMVTVRDEWGNSKDLEGPCDPKLLFHRPGR
jgi:hypothetical protein